MHSSVLASALARRKQLYSSTMFFVGGLFYSVSLVMQKEGKDDEVNGLSSHSYRSSPEGDSKTLHELLSSYYLPSQQYTACNDFFDLVIPKKSKLRRNTLKHMQETSAKKSLQSMYDVQWQKPLGEGGFGAVYLGTDKSSGELVAIKKISKRFTNNSSFQQEMDAFLFIRQSGGHPNICGLRENFDEGASYYLVLDLVQGGEMFDHLIENGAYSEADAARLVREVGSALAFLHGIGVVHGDLKPENLMLSSQHSSDAVIKVVDLGCAQVIDKNSPFYNADMNRSIANTPGYSPPEVVAMRNQPVSLEPSVDMFAMGVIIYIMLTGLHPFDISGQSTLDEMNRRVLTKQAPPLRNSSITAHLSPSAIDLIEKLIQWDPTKRMTALQLLNHPWVRGETARTGKIADSDLRLKAFRAYKSRLEAKVFASMVQWSDSDDCEEIARKTSLLERSFHMLDSEHRGYITTRDLENNLSSVGRPPESPLKHEKEQHKEEDAHLSFSGFSDLLAENMKNRYFPAGHVIYREGDRGHSMYFINSGRVEVYTKDGFKTITEQGDFFGEGALLGQKGRRNASIRCVTPVHAIEISREYFEKYLADGYDTSLSLREKTRLRRRIRARSLLSLQRNLRQSTLKKGEYVYKQGEDGDELYLIESGVVDVDVDNHTVFTVQQGELCGEYSLVFGRPRNTSAKCMSDQCSVQAMTAACVNELTKSHPFVQESLREIALRRQFQKALVYATKKSFPTKEDDLREAFDAVDYNKSGQIDLSDCALMLRKMDSSFTDKDIAQILNSLDLDESGSIDWEEFKRVFGISGTRFFKQY